MENLKRYSMQIIEAAAELLLGVVLLIDPKGFTSAVVVVAGAFALVAGVVSVVKYLGTDPVSAMKEHALSSGLFFVAVGLFCIFKTSWVIDTFSAVTVLYGFVTLVFGFVKIQNTADLLRLKQRGWAFCGVNAILTVAFAAVMLLNPFETLDMLCRFTGASLVVIAVLDFAAMIAGAVVSRKRGDRGVLEEEDHGDEA